MSIIIPANTLAAGGFDVDNSCRFETNTSLTKDIDSTNTSWTFSLWVKRTKLSATQYMISYGDSGVTNAIGFSAANLFQYYGEEEGYLIATAAALTDTSAWYHLVCKNASGTITMYVNGVAIPTTGGTTGSALSAGIFRVGAYQGGGLFFGGYMAEVCFIDSAALNPTSFGEFDEDSGIWKAIDVSGLTFGTDGFYLDYEASGNLGNDANGATDLTENNIVATDQATDTCTNNFALANPLNVNAGAVGTFAFGNTTVKVANSSGAVFGSSSTLGMTTGKWYCEVKIITVDSTIAGVSANASEDARDNVFPGYQDHSVGILFDSGNKYISDSGTTHGDAFSANDILMIALDLDNNNVYFGHNGNWFDGSGNADESNPTSAISITAAASTQDGAYFFTFGDGGGSAKGKVSWNFGNASHTISSGNTDGDGFGNFEYAVPSGYFALCTKNLAEYG